MNEFRQLRYFLTVAETLHFGRAAKKLHLSQPPLSRGIAALEESVGARLFERHTRRTELTPAGRLFLEDAKTLLATYDRACANARRTEAGDLGELRIGFMMHAASSVVPPMAKKFLHANPGVKLHLRETLPSSLPADIADGRFDAGILFPPDAGPGLACRRIHRERFLLCAATGHRLAKLRAVTPADLDDEGLLAAPESVSGTLRAAITGWFAAGGKAPDIRLETQLQQTLVHLAAEGLGVAIVPASLKKIAVENVVWRELADAPEIETVLAWRADNTNPALSRLLALFE